VSSYDWKSARCVGTASLHLFFSPFHELGDADIIGKFLFGRVIIVPLGRHALRAGSIDPVACAMEVYRHSPADLSLSC
jgi:hypothetical protein